MNINKGFTLIELSVVLVIIGLLVGGVLVGQDLIRAAEVRATITQIEKYQTAANTFRGKYGGLPGDISAALVTQFGFKAAPSRAGIEGRGDGNSVLEGYDYANPQSNQIEINQVNRGWAMNAEIVWFWEDLSTNSGLIEGSFNYATDAPLPLTPGYSYINPTSLLLPEAKVANGNYVYVWSSGGVNYFGLSNVNYINGEGNMTSKQGIRVKEAYDIDKKIDDGLPTTGNVQAFYDNGDYGGDMGVNDTTAISWSPNAETPSFTTCYDTTTNQYSVTQNGGLSVECGLSFQFDTAD